MEVMNATTRFTPDRCEVWVTTQNGEAAFAATLAASGRPADKCEVYKIHLPSPVPRLAGMDCAVIVRSMQDFKSGQRRPRGDVALHLGLTREALVETPLRAIDRWRTRLS